MCSRTTAILVVTSPVWLPLFLLLAALAALWTAVGTLCEYPTAGGIAVAGTLVGVLAKVAGEEGGGAGYRGITWDAGVVALVGTAVAVAVHGAVGRAGVTRWVAAASAAASLGYVVVKGGVGPSAPGGWSQVQVAMLVLAAVLPAFHLGGVLRAWRYASPEGCAAVEARILTAACTTPYKAYTAAGMHTVEFTSPAETANPLREGGGAGAAGAGTAGEAKGDTRPAMVWCHGYMSGTAMFMYNFDAFTPDYRVFSIDWLGCASSTRPRFTATTTAETESFFLDALEAWRIAVGLDSMVLVGHSLGGYLSAVYAMRHPARVRHLVLVSPAGIPNYGLNPNAATGGMVRSTPSSPTPRAIPRPLWAAVAWAWDNDVTAGAALRWTGPCGRTLARASVRGRFSRLVLSRPVPPPLLRDMGDYYYHNIAADGSGEFALRHILAPGARGRHPIGDRMLAAVRDGSLPPSLPVTILYGGTHDWMSFAGGKALVDGLTAAGMRATVGKVSPGGHHLYLESPDDFNAQVLADLAVTFKGSGSPTGTGAGAPSLPTLLPASGGGAAGAASDGAAAPLPSPPATASTTLPTIAAASVGAAEVEGVGSPAVVGRRFSGRLAGGPMTAVVSAVSAME